MTKLDPSLVTRVLARLEVPKPYFDLAGLSQLYAAWCVCVPFDNVQKLVHLAAGRGAPLPGSTSAAFFEDFLATGAGGTCWSGNNALHDLLVACGFTVERVAATMMTRPDQPACNHGSVLVQLGNERYIADASILSGVPLRIPAAGEAPAKGLPRIEYRDGQPVILWRTPRAPEGFTCRIDKIGITAERWDALHQHTLAWSPFNYAVTARILRAGRSIGISLGERFAIDADGKLTTSAYDRDARDAFLVDELGIAPELVAQLPDDREVAPAPAGYAPLPP